jgi:hypothetical protein
MLKGLITAGKLILGLFALVQTAAVVTAGACLIAYQNDPQTHYILIGGVSLLVAILADVG